MHGPLFPHWRRVSCRNHFTRFFSQTRDLPLDLTFSSILGRQSASQSSQHCSGRSDKRSPKMSSPSQRRTRGSQSGTPRRSARQSDTNNTPQNGAEQPGASSPLFFESSPAPNGGPAPVSSPLRQMSNSQSTQSQNAALPPSSPLRQMMESQEAGSENQRTPRASGQARGTLNRGRFSICTNRCSLFANAI